MSGVELKTVQDYQAAIQKLDKNNPADRKKIEEYCEKIGELLANKGIVEADSTKIKVEKGLGVESQNKVPSKESVSATDQFNPDVVGKKAAYANIRKAYGADKFDQARYDTLKNEIKDLDKKIKELDKKLDKLDSNDINAYTEARQKLVDEKTDLKLKKATLEEEKNTLEDYKLLQKDSIVGAIANAYKKNAKAAENVNSVQNVVNKDRKGDVERYLAEHPELQESDLTLISNGVEKTLLNIYTAGRLAIKKAEATGDEKTIKEAHEIYDDYVNIYKTDSEGRITEINTDAAKKVMARETGGGLELNHDEKKEFSVKVDDSEKNIKKAFRALGFDVEGAGKDKAKAAGLAFATAFLGTGLAALFGHSHKTASASATAQGETVQKDISWLASNGEAFTSLVEAQGGEAAVSVVAEACAKIPWLATLGAPALAGLAAYLLAKGKTEDVLNGANLKEALNNIKGADDKARPVLRDIKEMEITGDPTKDMAIKLAVLAAKQGESTKALNERELVDAREALLQLKEAIPKIEDEASNTPTEPTEPTTPTNPTEQTTPTEPTEPTEPTTPATPAVAPENLKGWARDHALFDKYNATERDKNGVDKGRVQMVEGTVVGVTGDYEAPDTIKMQDDTNKDRIKGKVDTFNYRKLTDEEIAAGKTKDGKTIQIPDEIKNAGKPLYILETAVNEKNQDIKAKHEEVYQLNLEKSEDGKTYNYKLEQYKGMSGSGVTSAVPAKTTTVKKAVTKPATGTGKADKAKTKEADPSTGKTEKEAAPIQYQYKFKGGTVVVPSPNEKGVYIDNATGDKYKRRPNGNFVKISSGTAKDTGKADKAKAKADPSTGTAKGTNKPKEAWINLQPGPVKGKGYMSDAERVRDAVTAKLPKFVNPAIIDEAVKQYQKGGLNAMNKYLQSQGFNYEFKAAV